MINEKVSPEGYEPTKKGIAYKVFKVKNGKLYPPMVANAGGQDTPIGVWLDAEEGEFAGLSKTGRPQVKSTGSGNLSYRPGWHLGDVPRASQFDRTNKETGEKEFPKDFVWAECEYAMDIDYQPESDARGYERTKVDDKGNVITYKSDKYQHSLAGVPHLPTNGYYKYRTNPNPDTVPWVITGQMKVNKLLSDDEVNKILQSKGIAPIHRQGGDKTLKELGLQEGLKEDINTEVDSLGNELSEEQVKFFKRSKVRDEEGHLYVCIHHSSNDFKEFKGAINWFSIDRAYSKQFGSKKYDVYLNCKNIFDCGSTDGRAFAIFPVTGKLKLNPNVLDMFNRLDLTEEEYRKFIEDVVDEREGEGYLEGSRDTYKYGLKIHIITRTKAFKKLVSSKGYDSISTVEGGSLCFGVFNSNDIKEVSNKKPTLSNNINERANKRNAKLNDEVNSLSNREAFMLLNRH